MSDKKNLSLVLNIILLIAVAALFVMQFSSNDEKANAKEDLAKTEKAKTDESQQIVEEESIDTAFSEVDFPNNYKIVYVDTDKMWDEYDFVERNMNILERSEKQMREQYESKYKKLEKDYTNFMKLGQEGLLSQSQQQQKAMELENQKQEIDALDMKLSDQLMRQRETLNSQLNDSILSFLDRYRDEHNYTFIFQYSYLNSILSADESLDITDEVVYGLNKEYNSFKDRL